MDHGAVDQGAPDQITVDRVTVDRVEHRRTLRRAAAGSLVLGLMALSSGFVWAADVSRDASALAGRTLDTRATAVEDAAEAEVARYSDALELVAAALGSVTGVDADAFDTAAAPLDGMDLAGATSLAFLAPPVTDGRLARFQAAWRTRGSTGLELDPVAAETTHVFAVLSRPLDGSSQRRTGVDVVGAPAPYAALREAQRSGRVSISDAYQLIIDQGLPESERQTSFSVVAPVVRHDRLVGWVLMGVRGRDFLGGVLAQAAEGRVDVRLMAADTAGVDLTVAAVSAADGPGSGADHHRRTIGMTVAQHTWTLEVSASTPALIGNIHYRPLAIRVIAVILALLVAGLWWVVASSRARSRAEIAAATRDLALAEAAARRQATLLDTMLETIDQVGVTVVDADGTFLMHSRAARQILGVETEPVAGDGPEAWQRHYGIFTLDGAPFAQDEMPLVRALAGEPTDDVEMLIRNATHPQGAQIVVSGRPIELAQQRPGALAFYRDVTADRHQQAEQAAFAGMVAHDLKNPLALVLGCLELVGDGVDQLVGPADVVGTVAVYLDKASAAAARMAGLIDDLLAYTSASDTSLDLADVDLGELVRDALAEVVAGHLATCRSAGREPLAPLVHVGELPTARCDPERMRQVVANLVGNALKYARPGTRPVVEVTAEVDDEHGVTRIFVADRGIGIEPELRTEVLKPFVRTPTTVADQTTYPGTGLGLAICQRIVERHGGRLLLRPNPGGGTVAVIDLPVPDPDPQPGAAGPDHSRRTYRSTAYVDTVASP
ncbi:ATP-binding protein [Nocardioides plantarum]|uniref:Sensor-like histidine kinase SenX3 n=1 Tax=Nocardioides plantarum TaxID=29299 RepID=A0ABV5KAV3_9ACTN|nr:ATP-binding protein [Nocardioides plantarum]